MLLTQTSWVLPPLSVGKVTLRLYGALNYSHGLSKGPSFGTGRDGFKQTEIGEIPEEWQLKRLAEVARVQTELATNKANAGPLSVPYLRVANVQDGFLILREMKSVEVSADALSRYALKMGDVLFTEGRDADKLSRGAPQVSCFCATEDYGSAAALRSAADPARRRHRA